MNYYTCRDLMSYYFDPRLMAMLNSASYSADAPGSSNRTQSTKISNREPRTAARLQKGDSSNESDRLKEENELLQKKIEEFEAEIARLKNGSELIAMQHRMNDVYGQLSYMRNVLQSKQNEAQQMKEHIEQLKNSNKRLRWQLNMTRREDDEHNGVELSKLTINETENVGSSNQNDLTSNAVRYAIEEFRKKFESRERDLDRKVMHWQKTADSATGHIIRLRDQIKQLTSEIQLLRSSSGTGSVKPECKQDDDLTADNDFRESDLPPRKRSAYRQ